MLNFQNTSRNHWVPTLLASFVLAACGATSGADEPPKEELPAADGGPTPAPSASTGRPEGSNDAGNGDSVADAATPDPWAGSWRVSEHTESYSSGSTYNARFEYGPDRRSAAFVWFLDGFSKELVDGDGNVYADLAGSLLAGITQTISLRRQHGHETQHYLDTFTYGALGLMTRIDIVDRAKPAEYMKVKSFELAWDGDGNLTSVTEFNRNDPSWYFRVTYSDFDLDHENSLSSERFGFPVFGPGGIPTQFTPSASGDTGKVIPPIRPGRRLPRTAVLEYSQGTTWTQDSNYAFDEIGRVRQITHTYSGYYTDQWRESFAYAP